MATTKWVLDPMHSEMLFKVKHLMISTVTGYFRKINLTAATENDNFTSVSDITFTVAVDSIDTKNDQRDNHLKSPEFFHAEQYPDLSFTGTRYEGNQQEGMLHGNLTIKGVTRPVAVQVEFGGIAIDPYGQTKAGITVQGKISRKEFGLVYSPVTEAGSVVIGDEVKFQGELQLIKQA